MIRRRAALVVAATIATGYAVAAALPAHAAGTPPPPGVGAGGGEAAALEAEPFQTCVSCTSVSGGPDGPEAHATPLRLLGHELRRNSSRGGSSERNAIVGLRSNPVLDLAVASWETGTDIGPSPAAWSRSALVDVGVLPAGEDSTTGGLLTVAVLESFSDAGWSPSGSHGYAASNGADIGVDNDALVIILLHSQATSDGHNNTYIASVDGQAVGANAGESSGMPLEVAGLTAATLFAVHTQRDSGSAGIGTVDRLLGLDPPVVGVLMSAANGVRVAAPLTGAVPAPPVARAAATVTGRGRPGARGVPATGAAPSLVGAVLALGGAAVVAVSLGRRRGR